MSSFRTKAFVAVFTIVSLSFGPYAALAQNSWTPPTQAPTGGNVPAPVNIGTSSQTKLGPLTIDNTLKVNGLFSSNYGSKLSGDTEIRPDTGGFGFMANFLESFFYNDVYIGDGTPFNGSGNEIPADLSVYGKFKYQTADSAGNPEPVNPGYVLVTNDEGYTEWADPSTITGGSSSLPFADEQGATLYWDIATNTWKVANNVKINGGSTNFFVEGTDGEFGVMADGGFYGGKGEVTDLTVDGTLRLDLANTPAGADLNHFLRRMPDGQAQWTPLFPGANNGDTIVWNGSTWVTTNVNNTGGAVPATATIGDTLRWNGTIWDKTSLWQVGPQNQPTRIATDPINTSIVTLTTNLDSASFISLSSPTVRIFPTNSAPTPGHILTATDATGKVGWTDPATVVGAGGLPPGTDNFTMRYNADTSAWEATDQITINDNNNDIWIGAESATGDVYISNGDSGTGSFLNSVDDNGKVNWNKYLIYEDIPYGQNEHIDSVTILESDEADRTSGFSNYGGYTYLKNFLQVDGPSSFNGPVVVDETSLTVNSGDVNINNGNLYIENLSGQVNTNNLISVCWNTETHRISKCTSYEQDPGGDFEFDTSETTEVFSVADNGEQIAFTEDATLELEWCGGGGGGGGGGLGAPAVDTQNQVGVGGGGGGGGAAGECESMTHTFSAGDVLSWNIGHGGEKGRKGCVGEPGYNPCPLVTLQSAGSGGTGEYTSLLLNGVDFGNIGYGGIGGAYGCSNYQVSINGDTTLPCYNPNFIPRGGFGGNTSLAGTWDVTNGYIGSSAWWHNGQFGFPNFANSTPGYGGMGGDGESPSEGNISIGNGSDGGGGGYPQSSQMGPWYFGKDGLNGILNYGGGGGGGSYGKLWIHSVGSDGPNQPYLAGGNGGRGGDGFVRVTGPANVINGVAQPNEVVYNTPGTFTFDVGVMSDNQQTYTVELWGGGGGGAPVSYDSAVNGTIKGGGGGAGSYVKSVYNLTPSEIACIDDPGINNCTIDYTVTVGAGGTLGSSAQTPASVTPATAGGTSRFCMSPNCSVSYQDPRAHGGQPGTSTTGGIGGLPQYTVGALSFQNGTVGQSASAGGLGGSAYLGAGKGGNGAVVTIQGGFVTPTSATSGAPGRVRISWD